MKIRTIKIEDEAVQVIVMKGNVKIANLLVFPHRAISVLSSDVKTEDVIIRHFGNEIKRL